VPVAPDAVSRKQEVDLAPAAEASVDRTSADLAHSHIIPQRCDYLS
jgi:hypothetical protein